MHEIGREIAREKAATLGRIARMLETHLETLARLRERARTLQGEAATAARAELATVHAEALRWRWYLVVQRESLGLRDESVVLERYPIPPLP